MRWRRLLAALTALCACVVHARALPLFTTQFVLPENSESLPAVSQKVHAYIEDLAQRAVCEKRALIFAKQLVLASYRNTWRAQGLLCVSDIIAKLAVPINASQPADDWL